MDKSKENNCFRKSLTIKGFEKRLIIFVEYLSP